jgi:hypothetical protein
MQHALRPYATAGVALVGASIIAVTPTVAPLPEVQTRPVQLVDAWSTLLTDTTDNLNSILTHADTTGIAGVFNALLTNPTGVLEAFTNLDPTVTTSGTDITVQLPPGLEVLIAQFGAEAAEFQALNGVVAQLSADPSNALNILYEGTASILNAGLNGATNVSLLDGIINIPLFNGILAPLQTMSVDLNLTDLINALGLGNLSLSNLDLSNLLSQIGLGDLTLGSLFSDLNISGDGLGTLLGSPTLSTLLSDLGLGGLGLGSFSLTSILSDLGLDTNVNLNNLNLDQILTAFGLDPTANVGLAGFLDNVGFSGLLNTGLGTELQNLGLLQGVLTDLNGVLGTVLNNPTLVALLTSLGLNHNSLLTLTGLEDALNADKVGDLLGGQTLHDSLANILSALGVSDVTPSNLTLGGLLQDLGVSSATGDLSLSQLLNDLGVGGLDVTSLLNNVTLGDLLGDLGLSNLPLDLSNLGDLSNLTLDGLLGDLGLGDIANISINNFGGLITELAEVIPQQILNSI